jgi:hypothetical protein
MTEDVDSAPGRSRGRKQCSSCNAFIGVRTLVCSCGFEFSAFKEEKVIERKTSNEPSRGRKECPSCKFFVGVRTRVCSCGQDFSMTPSGARPKKEEKVVAEPVVPAEDGAEVKEVEKPVEEKPAYKDTIVVHKYMDNIKTVVIAEKGFPHRYPQANKEDMLLWIKECQDKAAQRKEVYSMQALTSWVAFKFAPALDAGKEMRRLLEETYKEMMN